MATITIYKFCGKERKSLEQYGEHLNEADYKKVFCGSSKTTDLELIFGAVMRKAKPFDKVDFNIEVGDIVEKCGALYYCNETGFRYLPRLYFDTKKVMDDV